MNFALIGFSLFALNTAATEKICFSNRHELKIVEAHLPDAFSKVPISMKDNGKAAAIKIWTDNEGEDSGFSLVKATKVLESTQVDEVPIKRICFNGQKMKMEFRNGESKSGEFTSDGLFKSEGLTFKPISQNEFEEFANRYTPKKLMIKDDGKK